MLSSPSSHYTIELNVSKWKRSQNLSLSPHHHLDIENWAFFVACKNGSSDDDGGIRFISIDTVRTADSKRKECSFISITIQIASFLPFGGYACMCVWVISNLCELHVCVVINLSSPNSSSRNWNRILLPSG